METSKKITKRKAFTLVELVIVIAVIAILAGVMIPTFGGIIKSAKVSNDEAMASSINVHLAMDLDGIHSAAELYKVIEDAYGAEKAAKFAPESASYGYHFWYDAELNKVALISYDGIPEYLEKNVPPEPKALVESEVSTVASSVSARIYMN